MDITIYYISVLTLLVSIGAGAGCDSAVGTFQWCSSADQPGNVLMAIGSSPKTITLCFDMLDQESDPCYYDLDSISVYDGAADVSASSIFSIDVTYPGTVQITE